MTVKLKPCPFCGKTPRFVESLKPYVICDTEYCRVGYSDRRMGGSTFLRETAIKVWNRRTQ